MAAGKRKSKKASGLDLVIKPIPHAVRGAFARKKEDNTPTGVMLKALYDAYGVDTDDRSSYKKFITVLMKNLSMLVTSGEDDQLFKPDFNMFLTLFVNTVNTCSKILNFLKQHGIDYTTDLADDEDDEDSKE